ncbi:sphingomyelin phosphodiesterase [Barrientosiimonas marina]|uniref:Sphingomyelin phosphodiesterase n=1 Tax=Lentibacillus kimchii TaxID=1542911 RepID=A0ABW2UTQ0_9BACI
MRKILGTVIVGCISGILLLANSAVQADANQSYPGDFEILSHNVYMMSQAIYPNWGQNQRAELISDADYVQNHDVIIFNELFDNEASGILLDGIRKQYPYQTPVLGRSTKGWDETTGNYSHAASEDGGVSIVSKWPIAEQIQHVFKDGCGVEALSNKGFIYIKIMKNNEPYHVIGTHVQSTDETLCSQGEPAKIRASQMNEIKSFISKKHIPEDEVVFIGGDLNAMKQTNEYGAMLQNLNVSEPDNYKGFNATWDPTSNSIANENYPDLNGQHLDYVFIERNHAQPNHWEIETKKVKSPVWSVTSWGQTYKYNDYSDHYPVIGTTKSSE